MNWDDIDAEQARIDAGVDSYIEQLGEPETLEKAIGERDFWIREACRFSRNEDYYRGLVDRIGEAIGPDAYTADDGSISEDVLRAKVPELVIALVSQPPDRGGG